MSLNEQLEDAIRSVVNSELSNVHTSIPARVESYDYTKQKASVKPLIKKKFANGTVLEMPIIVNVPVVFPRGGGAVFTFPIKKGDTVLLLFAERSIDTWLANGGIVEPSDKRKFSLSDGIAIAGLVDFSGSDFPANNDDVILKYSGGSIVIHDDGQVDINDGNLTVDL